jgi:hypothetical protein
MADWNHAETLRQHAHEPGEAEIQRVRRRAMERLSLRRRPPAWAWVPVAAAVAAAVIWLAWPQGSSPQPLASADDWSQADAQPGVQLAFHGQGQVSSPSVVAWEQGELKVEVEPERGIEFRVETEEASIRVVGTVFAVERSSLGTSVTVERGEVEVTCLDEATRAVSTGEAWLCLRSPAAALHWADSHQDGSAAEVLQVLDRGLARSAQGDPVHDELEVLRIRTLSTAGEPRQAYDAATERLGRGALHRAREVRQIAARTALALDGCGAALPHLEVLAADDSGAAMVHLADCVTPDQPERARALLERALTLAPPAGQAAAIEQRLAALDDGGAIE